ncbi:mechanosensitive ion channel [Nitratireductor sp. CAU 1489]|uniref:Small-conductance mechanosensitive channel n=1 Tax=Nitratireductor arenosus TaxID=2682096 RepID=A0A844QCK0_9HYPH|nr:mechanosensitive ion channel domain-containing protein [Nitratireductor arenosus]MVA96707.1 mechanosensitive ion channel [Nitratireductor arenosus]
MRRAAWPALALIASVVVYLVHWRVIEVAQLEIDAAALGLIAGAASYFAAAWLGGRLIGLALEHVGSRRRRVPKLLVELVSVALFIAATIATIILVFGQSLSGALAGSGLVLAVLGFAIRNVLADVLSGIALGLEAPYRIGDWVEVDDAIRGRIVEIGWRTTRLLTRDDTYTILPNSRIARQRLTNYSAPRRHYRTNVQILLDHEVPVALAKTMLARAAAKPSIIQTTPAPDVRVVSYEAEGIRYAVRFWVPSFAEDIDCRDAVLSSIDIAIRENGLRPPQTRLRVSADSRGRTAAPAPH